MPVKKKRQRNAAATQEALIKAGAKLFSLRGYDGCRNQLIADEAGANKAMISYHFGGKLGLYRAVAVEAVDATRPLLESFRKEAKDWNAVDRMAAWIRTLDACFQLRPYLAGLLLREHLDGGSRLQKEYQERISQFFLTTAWVLNPESDTSGDLDVSAHNVHLALVGSLSFYLVSQSYRDHAEAAKLSLAPAPEREKYIDYLVRLHVDGLFPSTPKKGK